MKKLLILTAFAPLISFAQINLGYTKKDIQEFADELIANANSLTKERLDEICYYTLAIGLRDSNGFMPVKRSKETIPE